MNIIKIFSAVLLIGSLVLGVEQQAPAAHKHKKSKSDTCTVAKPAGLADTTAKHSCPLAKSDSAAAVKKDSTAAPITLKPQTTCPVMQGNPINKKIFVDYKGQRVYFCCNMCPPEFKKDPEKYLKKLTEMGQAPEIIKK